MAIAWDRALAPAGDPDRMQRRADEAWHLMPGNEAEFAGLLHAYLATGSET